MKSAITAWLARRVNSTPFSIKKLEGYIQLIEVGITCLKNLVQREYQNNTNVAMYIVLPKFYQFLTSAKSANLLHFYVENRKIVATKQKCFK